MYRVHRDRCFIIKQELLTNETINQSSNILLSTIVVRLNVRVFWSWAPELFKQLFQYGGFVARGLQHVVPQSVRRNGVPLLTEMHTIDGHNGKIRLAVPPMEDACVSVEWLIDHRKVITVELGPMAYPFHYLHEASLKLPVEIPIAGVLRTVQTGALDGTHKLTG